MRVYFDESGQSGCVLQKKDLLNFQKQPTFAIGAVVVPTNKSANMLVKKYADFKDQFGITGEIKGSDLLTRARNEDLEFFIKNILNQYHFFVLLYDKRFYISTLLLLSLVGLEYQHTLPEHFYQQATMLSYQKDDFFIRYLKYIENPGIEAFSEYLKFLIDYKYIYDEGPENAVVTMAEKIIEAGIEDKCYDDFLSFGWYDNPKITNLINLTALSELIYFIKSQFDISNQEISYVHDHIKEFEDTIHVELQDHGINIEFADSKNETMLQIVDNAVSILRHAYDKGIAHIKAKEMWEHQNEWDMELLARVIKKLSTKHISFTIPRSDWAAVLCTEIMFGAKYPKKYRNNIQFNYYYRESLIRIYSSISSANQSMDEIIGLLQK